MRCLFVVCLVVLLLSCTPAAPNQKTTLVVVIAPKEEDDNKRCELPPVPTLLDAPKIPYISKACEDDMECVDNMLLDHISELRAVIKANALKYENWVNSIPVECK